MAIIRVSTVIERAPEEVWRVIEDVENHTEWMNDAEAIRFVGDQRQGVGTTFDCDTKIGPAKLTDRMEITKWVENEAMGVRHVGLVTGEGTLSLHPAGKGRTEFRWEEELVFPFWMGGPLRNPVGGRILEWVWRKNLKNLKEICERPTPTQTENATNPSD